MKDYTALTKDLLTVQQAAEYLHKSEASIRSLLWDGLLTGVKIGHARLLEKEELNRYRQRKGL